MSQKLKTVSVISLGCPKNRVDSEVILGELGKRGYHLTAFPEEANVIIINTCSFIEEAREESYNVIKKVSTQKKPIQKLIICGCLPQLLGEKLFDDFPAADALIGSADFDKLPGIIPGLSNSQERVIEISEPTFLYNATYPRLLSTPPSYAYLKISEGCSNCCSYCRIPSLRGNYRGRESEDIISEAQNLTALGVKEIILVGQDTTNFGKDKGKYLLAQLLQKLEEVNSIKWIRLMYTHPAHFTPELISVLAQSEKICNYIDIPLQHTHDEILSQMRRPKWKICERVINEIRDKMPNIVLRTTFIVGFPGETEKHFDKLMQDVTRLKFDWLGAFTYSREEGTSAAKLRRQVPEKIKEKRLQNLLTLQKRITKEKNKKQVGKTFPVLVDTEKEGHTSFQAPDLDGKVFLTQKCTPGELFLGRVKKVRGNYDLEVDRC